MQNLQCFELILMFFQSPSHIFVNFSNTPGYLGLSKGSTVPADQSGQVGTFRWIHQTKDSWVEGSLTLSPHLVINRSLCPWSEGFYLTFLAQKTQLFHTAILPFFIYLFYLHRFSTNFNEMHIKSHKNSPYQICVFTCATIPQRVMENSQHRWQHLKSIFT